MRTHARTIYPENARGIKSDQIRNRVVNGVNENSRGAALLNEFLKEHRTMQELKTTVVEQQKQIEALTAGLQKVSAQLELNKPAQQKGPEQSVEGGQPTEAMSCRAFIA